LEKYYQFTSTPYDDKNVPTTLYKQVEDKALKGEFDELKKVLKTVPGVNIYARKLTKLQRFIKRVKSKSFFNGIFEFVNYDF